MVRVAFAVASLVITLVTLFALIWTITPGPTYRLLQLSVGAAELSGWVGLVTLIGICFGLVTLRLGSRGVAPAALAGGLAALILAIIPPFQAFWLVAREDVSISLRRYLWSERATVPLEEIRNVPFAEVEGQTLRLDVYRPLHRSPDRSLPALVVVHGGAWDAGAKGEYLGTTRIFARKGMVVFDIEYRLAKPGQQFPVQVADVKCAIGWVKRSAAAYGADPERIALLGRSAGGNLALLAAYTSGHPALAPSCDAGDTSVSTVISFYAPVDMVWSHNNPARPDVIRGTARLRRFLGGTPDRLPDVYQLASPHLHVGPQTPPTLIIHGQRDQVVSVRQADFLVKALEAANVPHRLVLLPWSNHGFDFAPHGWGSQIAQAAIHDFLATYLVD